MVDAASIIGTTVPNLLGFIATNSKPLIELLILVLAVSWLPGYIHSCLGLPPSAAMLKAEAAEKKRHPDGTWTAAGESGMSYDLDYDEADFFSFPGSGHMHRQTPSYDYGDSSDTRGG